MDYYVLQSNYLNYLERDIENENTKKKILNFYNKIKLSEEKFQKPIIYFDAHEMTNLIKSCNTIGYNGGTVAKSFIRRYLKWVHDNHIDALNAINILNNIDITIANDVAFNRYYFKDAKKLQKDLDNLLDEIIMTSNKERSVYNIAIASAYLAWIGVEIHDAINLKKKDVTSEGVQIGHCLVPASQEMLDFLYSYKNDSYYVTSRGPVSYANSSYLLRSSKSDHLTEQNVRAAFSRLNNEIKEWPKKFNYEKIYLSGVFYRAYQREEKIGGFPTVFYGTGKSIPKDEKELCESIFMEKFQTSAQLRDRIAQYKTYKDIYYPK